MQKNDEMLFLLVKTMTKSEKRQFKIFAHRLPSNKQAHYVQLFDALVKLNKYDDAKILEIVPVKKQQLPNLKQNLYHQILSVLRTSPAQKTLLIELREWLDFATILYNKGLYQQSLKILDRAKAKAIDNFENTLAFEIVEFEKMIETQYITRSLTSRADDLAITAKNLSVSNVLMSKLSNLSLQLYSFFLKYGYAKSEEDIEIASNYYTYHLPKFSLKSLGFREKLFLSMSQLWHSLIIQDFLGSYRHAMKWVTLFREYEGVISTHPVYFLKGGNYLLESLYFLRYRSKFEEVLLAFEKAISHTEFPSNKNIKTLKFLYLSYHQINLQFLTGEFEKGIEMIPDLETKLEGLEEQIDEHHRMVFYYKFSCLYFGKDLHDECINYLNKIIDNKQLGMREDLLCFSRILRLISYYEAGKDELLEYYIRDTFKFLIKMNDLHLVQKEMIAFLKRLNKIYPHELRIAFEQLYNQLKALENHKFEKRSFLYLDILSWLEGKIKRKKIQTIVMEKALEMK